MRAFAASLIAALALADGSCPDNAIAREAIANAPEARRPLTKAKPRHQSAGADGMVDDIAELGIQVDTTDSTTGEALA